jgi:hypothetical protein
LHHRGSKDSVRGTKEEWIIAEADAMSHFDNIAALFSLAYAKMNLGVAEGREFVKAKLERDFAKLRPETRKMLESRFEQIMEVVGGSDGHGRD